MGGEETSFRTVPFHSSENHAHLFFNRYFYSLYIPVKVKRNKGIFILCVQLQSLNIVNSCKNVMHLGKKLFMEEFYLKPWNFSFFLFFHIVYWNLTPSFKSL